MKKISIIAILIVSALSVHAQRFEWATGYTSQKYNDIIGGVTDSFGNLYILGHCDYTSKWNGQWVTPSLNNSSKNDPPQTLIAKVSSEGVLMWKKVIFSNNGGGDMPYGIKKLGDTAFACLVEFTPAKLFDHYTYFLDTFLFDIADNPIEVSYMFSHISTATYTAYLVFDFNGNLKEKHFLCITYTDANGNDIVQMDGWLQGRNYEEPTFDVDSKGNIYIGRRASDVWCVSQNMQDSIRGLKFWVDGRVAGECEIDVNANPTFPQLLKFSPHFDTLLAIKHVVQRSEYDIYYNPATYRPFITKVDPADNVYFICSWAPIGSYHENSLIIDTLSGISFHYEEKYWMIAFLAKFDTNLNAKWVIAFNDSIIDTTKAGTMCFYDLDFDIDSNLLFLFAGSNRSFSGDNTHLYSALKYQGITLNNIKSDWFFCSFKNNDTQPTLHSYARVPLLYMSGTGIKGVCRNNRVLLQCQYSGGISFPTRNIMLPNKWYGGIALSMFDYSGQVFDGIDYGVSILSEDNVAGPLVPHDSVLYLIYGLAQDARFGDIDVLLPSGADEYNVIAKYVDTAFMHPYVRPSHGINTVAAVTPRVYPVPATDRLHFDCPAGVVPTAVAAISLSGWRMPLTATATTADISCLAPGAYILEITTNKEKYYSKFIKGR